MPLIVFPCGMVTAFGFMLPYLASFLRLHDSSIRLEQVQWCFYIYTIARAIASLFVDKIIDKLGYKSGLILSTTLYGIPWICLGFITNLYYAYVVFFFVGTIEAVIYWICGTMFIKLFNGEPCMA